MNEVQVVVFSKNRAMQLDCCLHSFFDNCVEKVDINVLYTTTSEEHENSYKILQKTYENVVFFREMSFKSDLLSILCNKIYILFVVDDAIFTTPFSLQKIINLLKYHSKTIGFSLRLGKNTNYNYPYDSLQIIPKYTISDNVMIYRWTTANLDFAYPVELSSSLYLVSDILPVLEQTEYKNPNDLEWMFYINLGYFANIKSLIACFETSVAFCNPINMVQQVNNNRSGRNPELNPEKLLELFNDGYRIYIEKFNGFVSNACHQEVELEFIKDDNEL